MSETLITASCKVSLGNDLQARYTVVAACRGKKLVELSIVD